MITELDLLMRALASPTRLRILWLLRRSANWEPGGVRQPWQFARELGIARPTVTYHLKVLLRMRLVNYRKGGRDKYYRLATVRRGAIRSRLLERVLPEIPAGLGPVPAHPSAKPGRTLTRPGLHSGANRGVLGPMWRALTSFSHFRRLRMLDCLNRQGHAALGDLMHAAKLSKPWALYHLDKLVRRGVVGSTPSGQYVLAGNPPTPLQDFLTRFLARQLAGSGV